jgi:hypothetical protein
LALVALTGIIVAFSAGTALASDLNLEVRLVWGTNDEKSPNPDHKPVDAKITGMLSKAFKWKKYFLVNSEKVDVASRATKKVKLSDDSQVEIRELEGDNIEIHVYGKGKLVRKIKEPLSKDGTVVIAGEDKNDCAWFIIVRNR